MRFGEPRSLPCDLVSAYRGGDSTIGTALNGPRWLLFLAQLEAFQNRPDGECSVAQFRLSLTPPSASNIGSFESCP
jgi:hypothetical protein